MASTNYEKLVSKIDNFFPLPSEEEYKLFKEQEQEELLTEEYMPVAELISAHLHMSDHEEEELGVGSQYVVKSPGFSCVHEHSSTKFGFSKEFNGKESDDNAGVFETGKDQWEKFMVNCKDVPLSA
ncbi:unnamed protein product [Ambrosiozyma monospora]|uniref:Unnamed protein product n=1 Tax=Ambrosiozyma monospora TaxID=43982 RepID=A0ACB5U1Y2_AMBMO|nr:unnamed protein product [Ambrosiozyma monospora]